MTVVERRRIVKAPLERVWASLADYGHIHRWHPLVKTSRWIGAPKQGPGGTRRCDFKDGTFAVEELTDWQEGKGLSLHVTDSNMPLARAAATFSVRSVRAGTEVTMVMDYAPKFGLVGRLMDRMMMRRKFASVMGQILDGLAKHSMAGRRDGASGTAPRPVPSV